MRTMVVTISGGLLALVGVTVLAMADANLFDEDPEFSPLYKATLEDAFSRFKASEGRVPPGGSATPEPRPQPPQQPIARATPQPGARGGLLGINKNAPVGNQRTLPGRTGAATPPTHVHDDGGPHMQRGSQLSAQRQYDQAIAEFRLALQENPSRSLAQHYIGDALRAQGKHDEAIAAYQATLAIKPDYYCCYTHMAEIREAQQNTAAAEAFYQQAIAGYMQQVGANGPQSNIAAYNLAKLYLDKNRGTTAEIVRFAEKAGNVNPPQAPYLHVLARAYEKAGRRDEALAIMNRVMGMQMEPVHRQYYDNYRRQLTAQGAAPGAAPGGPPAAGGR